MTEETEQQPPPDPFDDLPLEQIKPTFEKRASEPRPVFYAYVGDTLLGVVRRSRDGRWRGIAVAPDGTELPDPQGYRARRHVARSLVALVREHLREAGQEE